MKLSKTLNFALRENNLDSLNTIIGRAQTKVTFWGNRVITVGGYKSSYSIKLLANKLIKLSYERCEKQDLSTKDREDGITLSRKVNKFYAETDAQIKQCNFLTRFFVWLREFSFIPYTTRFYVEETLESNFKTLSEENILKHFGI